MNEIIAQIRQCTLHFNPACSDTYLDSLTDKLDYALDSQLRELYADHNGSFDKGDMPFRLMPTAEVVQAYPILRTQWGLRDALRAFWTDDHSNYACLYIAGPLEGKICLFMHDEPDLAPAFRSIQSFYTAGFAADASELADLMRDYPLLQPTSPQEEAQDRALALHYAAQYAAMLDPEEDADERVYLASCAMNLLPVGDTERLLEFAHDSDMWIQERACKLLGMKRFFAALPILAMIARTGTYNGRAAAIGALGSMQSPEAHAELLHLAHEAPALEALHKVALGRALRSYGYEVERRGDTWHYRTSPDAQWEVFS